MSKLLQFLARDRTRLATTRSNLILRYASLATATATGFIMVPLYLAYIPADIYGFWLAAGYFLVLMTTCDPGLSVVLQQKVAAAYGQRNMALVGAHIGSGLFLSAIVCSLVLLAGVTLAFWVPSLVGVTSPDAAKTLSLSFSFAIAGTALALFSFSISAINQGLQSSWAASGVVLLVNVVSSALTAVMLIKGLGVQAIAIGAVVAGGASTLAQATYLILRLRVERCPVSLSNSHTKSLGEVFTYTIVGRAASAAANNIDLLVVCKLIDARAVVMLSVSRKAVELSRELVNQLVVSFMPALSHLQSEGAVERTAAVVTRLTRILIWLSGFVVGGVMCFNDDFVSLWLGGEQFVGASLNLMLATALLIGIGVTFLQNIGICLGNFKGNSIASAVQSVAYVGLVVAGSMSYGLAGTILAPALAPLLGPLYYYVTSVRRSIRLSAESQKALGIQAALAGAVTLAAVALFSRVGVHDWYRFFATIVAYTGAFLLLACSCSVILRSELRCLFGIRAKLC